MEPKHPKSPQTGPWTCLLCAAGDPIPRPQQIPIRQRNGRNPALGPSNDAHSGRHPVPSARHPAGMDAHRSVAEPPSATVTLAEIDRDKTRMDTPELGQPCSPPIPAKRDPAASLLEPARLSRESRTVWLETWATLASLEHWPAILPVLDSFVLSAHPRAETSMPMANGTFVV